MLTSVQFREVPFGVAGVQYYFPPERRHIKNWAAETGNDAQLVAEMENNGIGYYHVASDQSIDELAGHSVEKLLSINEIEPCGVDILIFVHSLQTSGLAPPRSAAAQIRQKFNFDRATCHSVSQQNCASLIATLRLVGSVFAVRPSVNRIIVVSADKCFEERTRNLGNYAMQSDASCAALLVRDHPTNRVGAVAFYSDGQYYPGYDNNVVRKLQLGKAYISNACQVIGAVIDDHQNRARYVSIMSLNISRKTLASVVERLGMGPELLYSGEICAHGHAFCSDTLINFADFVSGGLNDGKSVILYSDSNSGSFGAAAVHNLAAFSTKTEREVDFSVRSAIRG